MEEKCRTDPAALGVGVDHRAHGLDLEAKPLLQDAFLIFPTLLDWSWRRKFSVWRVLNWRYNTQYYHSDRRRCFCTVAENEKNS